MKEDHDISWQENAACAAPYVPLEWFWTQNKWLHAKRMCSTCPVRLECLEYAIDIGEYNGIWGGYTPDQRRRYVQGHDPGPVWEPPNTERPSYKESPSVRKRWNIAEARRLFSSGLVPSAIAKHMGVTQKSVYRYLSAKQPES